MEFKEGFDFKGRVAIVTGAGGSIGRSISIGFASCGANVVVVDLDRNRSKETCSLLPEVDGGHLELNVDLTNSFDIQKMVDVTVEKFGKIDFLANHAGMNIRKPAEEFTTDDWNKVCDINLKSNFFVAQKVGIQMLKQGFGRIVNTASVSAKRGHPNLSIYAATKGGVVQLTKVLGNEWSSRGVNVNAVAPGYVKTNQTEGLLSDKKRYDRMISLIPMGRFGETDEMVGTILFFCSPLADYITGQTLYVDGGRTID